MRKLVCVLVLIMFALQTVIAADTTIKSNVVYTEKETKTSIVVTFLNAAKSIVGMEQEPVEETKTTIVVQINGDVVAEIPKGSKFEGMEVHDYCLVYQYGTDLWYECEVSLV